MARENDPYARAPRLPEEPERLRPEILVTAPAQEYELEIGPGRGGFIFERLESAPGSAVIGLEIRRKWGTLVDDRLEKMALGKRGRVFAEDARLVLPRFEDATFHRVFMHFPDPWWKKRHAKRRLASVEVSDHIARLLVDGGTFLIQTDVEERAEEFAAAVSKTIELVPFEGTSPLVPTNDFGARSPREHRAIADGLPVHRLLFKRIAR